MAKIRRIRPYSLKDGTTGEDVYPITVTDAVIYSETGTSLTKHIHPRIILTQEELNTKISNSDLKDGYDYMVYET